jgi:ferrochelatase
MTAHSLPLAVVGRGDPYPQLVEASAHAIADALGRSFVLGYQSQGADRCEWLGPDLVDLFGMLRDSGASSVLVAPIGFLADHIETLYDLDIEAARLAEGLGLEFTRVPALNTDRGLIEAMAHVVEMAMATAGVPSVV